MESTVEHCWHKSSYSGNGGGDCVEVARNLPHTVAVRDSKDPHGPVLAIESAGWQDFLADVKAGRLRQFVGDDLGAQGDALGTDSG